VNPVADVPVVTASAAAANEDSNQRTDAGVDQRGGAV